MQAHPSQQLENPIGQAPAVNHGGIVFGVRQGAASSVSTGRAEDLGSRAMASRLSAPRSNPVAVCADSIRRCR